MKNLIITILCVFTFYPNVYSQNNQMEAKAAYLLAEESFANKDYASTLGYLENATKNL